MTGTTTIKRDLVVVEKYFDPSKAIDEVVASIVSRSGNFNPYKGGKVNLTHIYFNRSCIFSKWINMS